ncbi:hypothetical protein GCM10009865_07090 [Aeromicrobium ponti]
MKFSEDFDKIYKTEKAMCDWRDTDYREGAHSVEAVRLGRGKGFYPLPLSV